MVNRSFNITIVNSSGFPLTRVQTETSHGTEVADVAPQSIPATGPDATQTFETTDDGFLTGTEAGVVYQVMDSNPSTTSYLLLNWQNPYEGSTTMTAKVFTYPIDANGAPLNGGGGSMFAPPLSDYEAGYSLGGQDGTDPGWNPDTVVTGFFFAPTVPIEIAENPGNIPHAGTTAWIELKATDLITWSKRHSADLSKGVRALNPPNGSVRALMQLPPPR